MLKRLHCICLIVVATAGGSPAAERWNAAAFGFRAPAEGRLLNVRWQGVPLSEAAFRTSSASETAVFLDRRIDPTRLVNLTATGDARRLLTAIAEHEGWGVSSLAGATYVGPREAATELKTLHARAWRRVAQLPRSTRNHFQRHAPLEWDRLASPREVVGRLLAERGVAARGIERLPHDLWPANRLPEAPLTEQLTLLLVGFDRDWRPVSAGSAIEILPIERPVRITARHRAPGGAATLRRELSRLAPDAVIESGGGGWVVRATVEQHDLIDRTLRGEQAEQSQREATPPGALANKRVTLSVREQPAGAVLTQITRSLGLELVGDPREPPLDRRISFRVEQATVEELLERIGREASVVVRLEGGRVVIRPVGEEPVGEQ